MRIATCNVNGLAGSEAAVYQAWKVLGLDILCLVETWIRPSDEVHIGIPQIVVSLEAPQSGRPHGGIAFFHQPDLQTRVWAEYATKSYQVLAINVKPSLNVVGVYITPNAELLAIHECLKRLKSLCQDPTVFMGDWIARHLDWDGKTKKQGRVLRNWMIQWNLSVRAPATNLTFLTPYGHSNVDFFVSCKVRVHNVSCENGSWHSVSDHSLVCGHLQWSPSQAPMYNKRISKAMLKNLHLLQEARKSYEAKLPSVTDEIGKVSSNSELGEACQRFASLLKASFESKHCSRPDRYRFFWDNHLDCSAKLRSKFYRKWKRRREIGFWHKYKDLDKLIKRRTRDKKKALLDEFSHPIQNEGPSSLAKRVNTIVKLRANRAASATERGNSLDPAEYTEYSNAHIQVNVVSPPNNSIFLTNLSMN